MSETMLGTATNPTEPPSSQAPVETPAEKPAETPAGTEQPTSSEPKPPVEKPAEAPKAEEKPAETKVEGAPEKYEFKAPEGVTYDEKVLGVFSEAAKEANLSQEAAQKVLEKMAPQLAQRQQEQITAIHSQWQEQSKTDKEFGGDQLKENLGMARKGLDNFATPELRTLLEDTGLGNHPEVIRYFWKVGKAISEDRFVSGAASPKSGNVNPAAVLYDNTKKE